MNYKPEVQVGTGKWNCNSLVFATREEAQLNVDALEFRWLAVTDTRVVETTDPVNYAWANGQLVAVKEGSDVVVIEDVPADTFADEVARDEAREIEDEEATKEELG